MSMFGKVTDLQIFSKNLQEEEMRRITNCEERKEGDVLSWDNTDWVLRGDNNIAVETLDFKHDICTFSKHSFHLLPQKRIFPDSVDSCTKLGGTLAEYASKDQYQEISQFLSKSKIRNSLKCKVDDNLSTWIGNCDTEGRWKTYGTYQDVTFLPWDEGRPFGGDKHNCMRLKLNVGGKLASGVVTDEECEQVGYCPLCRVEQPMLKMFVRGLCKQALFDNVYLYNIDDKGNILYVGEGASVITYNENASQWEWYDMRDNRSVATSSAPHGDLIGVVLVDFKGVFDD